MDWLMSKLGFKREVEVVTPKNISEPVISFLKVFENNPRRFKIRSLPTPKGDAVGGFSTYELVDTHTKESFKFLKKWYCNPEDGLYGTKELGLPDFLTLDEKKLVVKTIWNSFQNRKSRLKYLKGIRKARNNSKERKRLTKIYQEGV